jgi:3-oxoadipate enol-lactonase
VPDARVSLSEAPPARSRRAFPIPSRPAPPSPLRLVPPGEAGFDLNTPPPGRWLDLGRRGRTWIREVPAPEGAPTLVMLHGLGATGGLNWAGSQYFLGDRFGLVTIDHRGHGRGIRTRDFHLEDCADDAAAAIEALGLTRPILVGYSMGGPVASLLWRRHPDLVGGLVLCATSRNFRGSPGEKLCFGAMGLVGTAPVFLPGRLIRRVGSVVGAVPIPQPSPVKDVRWAVEELAGHDPRSILQAAAAVGSFDCFPWIGRVDVPTAVVVTTEDRIVPPARQFRLARAIPDASVHCVHVGHFCVGGGAPKVQYLTELRRACLEVARA